MGNQPEQKQVQIQIMDTAKDPIYANAMQVSHTQDEFIMDFMKFFPPTATLNARIIITPGHVKRIIKALQENVAKYEGTFGQIKESSEPSQEIGFGEKK
jgi:hypothetical protein